MDETDTPVTGPEALSAEAARQWAEQRRAQARAQFSTPSWIGPDRGGEATAQVPPQPEPEHDELEIPVPRPTAKPRMVAGTMLVLALAGLLTSLVLTITTQSAGAIVGLAASALVAVIFRGALMGSGIMTVDVKGSNLRIRRGGVVDVINLADPVHLVELVGSPDQPTWRVLLETVDGRTIEVGPKQVDAPELHRIVEYYRAIAQRNKEDRERRFNR